jgi:anaerobic ribonucleoside-triphosphate reductase activating protein
MKTNPASLTLNLAALQARTRALGPGERFALWVQGCALRCPGCLAPEWLPQVEATRVSVAALARQVLSEPGLRGLTFSGGEPMLQAWALAALVRTVRRERPALDVICFSGYRYERLRAQPPGSGVAALLAQVDLLIDGAYVAALNDGRGLRGSRNQRFIHLSDRLSGIDFASQPRRVEAHLAAGEAFLVGIPPLGLGEAWQQAEQAARRWLPQELSP